MNRYLTTPIYYASGLPHLGHTYTTLIADCYQRYYRLRGDNVRLITGTDEHGQKIERLATLAGIDPQAFVDEKSRAFASLWSALDIDVDAFVRTTDPIHQQFAQAFWQRLVDNEDIYLGTYEGLYCVDCEQYFAEGDVCPVHRKPLEQFSEASYFFRLSKYQDLLIEYIESHDRFILPVERRNEVLSFLRGNVLRDLSVSRASTQWGVPVPGDADHVLYVWVDALVTYLTALAPQGPVDLFDADLQTWWCETTHFIGKDILTFHAVHWPALLFAAGLPLPKQLIVNGWLTVEGRKIAKSDPDTIVDPVALTNEIGRDGLTLYLTKNVVLGQDVDFSRASAIQLVNADLANNLGNLVSRFAALARKQGEDGWGCGTPQTPADRNLLDSAFGTAQEVERAFTAATLAHGARAVVDASARINAYVQQSAPWQEADADRRATILRVIHQALCDLTILATPFVPTGAAKARAILCLDTAARWQDIGARQTCAVRPGAPLYPRLAVDLS